jgi:hypothetical protein
MEKKIKEILLAGCIFTFIGISCKEKPTEAEKADPEGKVVSLSAITGNYLILFGNVQDFKALNSFNCPPNLPVPQRRGRKVGGVVMKYKIAPNGLLLDGWQIIKKGNNDYSFSTKPNFSLMEGGISNIPYNEGTYLGSIVIDNCFLQKIKENIRTNPQLPYIIFTPDAVQGGKSIFYNVALSNSPTGLISGFDSQKFKPDNFKSIPIGKLDDPIPPGGGGILDSNE